MDIIKANIDRYDEVRSFYHTVIDGFDRLPFHPMWEKDLYPSPEQLRDLLAKEEMYLGVEDGQIIACMALNHDFNESYNEFDWPTKASKDEVYVIHMLGVHPDHGRKGVAKEMVRYAIDKAKLEKAKAIRLDVLKGNFPANKLYEYFGFKKLYTLPMYYPDTGWTDFELYEYKC